jgi:hypothetical protein
MLPHVLLVPLVHLGAVLAREVIIKPGELVRRGLVQVRDAS